MKRIFIVIFALSTAFAINAGILTGVIQKIMSSDQITAVTEAISKGEDITIRLEGKEVDPSTGEDIGKENFHFDLCPNNRNIFTGERTFSIGQSFKELDYIGQSAPADEIILRTTSATHPGGNLINYIFFFMNDPAQPRYAFCLFIDDENAIPLLHFNDGHGNLRYFFIPLCTVIGADESILLDISGTGQIKLKQILESIAKTVKAE